jgi:hypothetical protein
MRRNSEEQIEHVKNVCKEKNCEFISYKPGKASEVTFKCSCGETCTKRWNHFEKHPRCKCCFRKSQSKMQFKSDELLLNKYKKYIKVEIHDLKILRNFKEGRTGLQFKCACGEVVQKRPSEFKISQKCRKCAYKNITGEKNHMWVADKNKMRMEFLVRKKMGHFLRRPFEVSKTNKNNKTFEILGYTNKDLINYMESFSTWEQLKNTKWVIDHIFPVKAFFDYKIYDPKIISCLENLQPMEFYENLKKGDNYCQSEFENWLTIKGVVFTSKTS